MVGSGGRVGAVQYGRLLVYPPSGRLLFVTDFHGQLRDFRRVATWFAERRGQGEDLYLLFAGDFVHGPRPGQRGKWLETDRSPELLDAFETLRNAHPDRVHSLLGNHEYGHLGGPLTQKFYRGLDDDVTVLCRRLGRRRSEAARKLFEGFSLLALTPCGVVFSHAAPDLPVTPDLIERIVHANVHRRDPITMQLTWPRNVPPDRMDRVLSGLAFQGISPQVSVYGHEVIPSGVDRSSHRQVVVSTSFAIADRFKTVVELDLSAQYTSPQDFRDGVELRRLYPDSRSPAVHVQRG